MDRSRRIDALYKSTSGTETLALGITLGSKILPGTIVSFFGDLGAGKTTLIKGIIHALTGADIEEINSPTFSYLAVYEGPCIVYHFDLYRLRSADDFLSLGFEEYLFSRGVCCIEWSERIAPLLPEQTISITLTHEGNDLRSIKIRGLSL